MKSNIFGGGDDRAQDQHRVPGRTQDNIFGSVQPAAKEEQKGRFLRSWSQKFQGLLTLFGCV